jgi:hypothetical protein
MRRCKAPIIPGKGRRLDPLRLAALACIFNDHAHAMATVFIVQITQDPFARMPHLHDRADALGGAQPEHGHLDRMRQSIAIQRDHLEGMAWQCKAAGLSGTGVEDV